MDGKQRPMATGLFLLAPKALARGAGYHAPRPRYPFHTIGYRVHGRPNTYMEEAYTFNDLYSAYLRARKAKRYRPYALQFERVYERELLRLHYDVKYGRYRHGSYTTFTVQDSKKRTIQAAPFRDRILHRAVCDILEPLFEKTFIYDSYACRKGKGTHAAVKRLQRHIKSLRTRENKAPLQSIRYLKCDIAKFFDSVDHDILLDILEKRLIKEYRASAISKAKITTTLSLCERIVRSVPKGIPIGNLTSQLFANVYLNELDQYIKRVLHERYYLRYMDDFLLLGTDADHLRQDRRQIKMFLQQRLKLLLHPKKSYLSPVLPEGVDFVGYHVFGHHVQLRPATVKRWKYRHAHLSPAKIKKALRSWRGYTKHARSWRITHSLLKFPQVRYYTP